MRTNRSREQAGTSTPAGASGGRSYVEGTYEVLAAKLRAVERDIEAARIHRRIEIGGYPIWGYSAQGKPVLDQGQPALKGDRVSLRDGAQVLVRPIEPDDASELERALQRIGALSRYQHLLIETDHLDSQHIAEATRLDHVTREALIALDPVTGEGVGLARYICDPDDAALAEAAFAVTDRWQGRGVGTALAERLAMRARDSGVTRVSARMFVGNERGRRLLEHVGDVATETRAGGTITITATLRPGVHGETRSDAPTGVGIPSPMSSRRSHAGHHRRRRRGQAPS